MTLDAPPGYDELPRDLKGLAASLRGLQESGGSASRRISHRFTSSGPCPGIDGSPACKGQAFVVSGGGASARQGFGKVGELPRRLVHRRHPQAGPGQPVQERNRWTRHFDVLHRMDQHGKRGVVPPVGNFHGGDEVSVPPALPVLPEETAHQPGGLRMIPRTFRPRWGPGRTLPPSAPGGVVSAPGGKNPGPVRHGAAIGGRSTG